MTIGDYCRSADDVQLAKFLMLWTTATLDALNVETDEYKLSLDDLYKFISSDYKGEYDEL